MNPETLPVRHRRREADPALDMAARDVGGRFDGLIDHAAHGSNNNAMVSTDRIAALGAVPSTGTVGDLLDMRRQRP